MRFRHPIYPIFELTVEFFLRKLFQELFPHDECPRSTPPERRLPMESAIGRWAAPAAAAIVAGGRKPATVPRRGFCICGRYSRHSPAPKALNSLGLSYNPQLA